MNHERRLYMLLGAVAIAVLTVFFLNTQTVDNAQHTLLDQQLREMRHVDALLNEDIIQARYQLLHNYGSANNNMRQLFDIANAMEQGPLHDYAQHLTIINTALQALRSELDRKQALLEDFKTDNALYKNSLHHLPHAVSEFSALHPTQRVVDEAEGLLRTILTYNLNGEAQAKHDLEQYIDRFRGRSHSLNSNAREHAGNILNHAQLVMRLRPTLDGEVNSLLQAPLEKMVTRLQEAYMVFYKYRVSLGENYLVALYVLSSLLLATMVYVLLQLRANSRELFQEKESALITLHSIGDGVITTDAAGLIDYVNPVAEVLTGITTADARGRDLASVCNVVDEFSYKPLENAALKCIAEGRVIELSEHALLCRADGQESAIEVTAAPIRDRQNAITGAVVALHDVTKTRSMARELQWHASHDPLTGLANRRDFEHRLQVALHSAKDRDMTHALLYLDLDQFKVVNDTCGHVAGDELLRQITVLLLPHLRVVDSLARLGGDEFGLLLESCPIAKATHIAEQMRSALQDFRFIWKNKVFSVSGSIGIATITRDSVSADEVLSAADVACYAAKDQGRNRVHVYEAGDGEIAQRHGEMQWTTRINHALEENRFRLFVQKIHPVNAAHANELHHELLLRMIDENGDIIPPGAFIPAAERYNIMPSIDRWVVSRVCKSLRAIQAKPNDIYAVNLSGHSLSDEHFLTFVVKQLTDAAISHGRICFEITETAAISNLARAKRFITTLKGMGCRFALDDFGMGLSSYAYLKNLPVDYLKIDGTFVKDMHDDPVDRELVRSVNQIAHVMGIKTIAECVETEAVWQRVVELNIDFAQGFYIDRPRLWLSPVSTPAAVKTKR